MSTGEFKNRLKSTKKGKISQVCAIYNWRLKNGKEWIFSKYCWIVGSTSQWLSPHPSFSKSQQSFHFPKYITNWERNKCHTHKHTRHEMLIDPASLENFTWPWRWLGDGVKIYKWRLYCGLFLDWVEIYDQDHHVCIHSYSSHYVHFTWRNTHWIEWHWFRHLFFISTHRLTNRFLFQAMRGYYSTAFYKCLGMA